MDLSRSCGKQEDDPAIMLFGKQIKALSTKAEAKIKEELSPRGVDERGLSFATSSDEEEDLNLSVEAICEDVMIEQLSQKAKKQWEKQKSNEEGECPPAENKAEKLKSKDRECPPGEDKQGGKQKAGIWSRCPRCNSADTKFCYFNNYNVNQPRHFCKHCQRYWTAGGSLRNVPVGAGKRKNKHTLHKQAFLTNAICASEMATRDTPLRCQDRVPIVNSDADTIPIAKSGPVNTNLELSADHTFTFSPAPPSLPPFIQSHQTIPPNTPHSLLTLHQLQLDFQSKASQLCPNLAGGSYKLSQIRPDLACEPSGLGPVYPNVNQLYPDLDCKSSGLSQVHPSESPGLSQIHPHQQSASFELSRPHRGSPLGVSQLGPHVHSGSCGLNQISPGLQSESSELGKISPDLQSGSFRLGQTCPHLQSGSCESSQECLDCRKNARSPGMQKSASFESGLPDLAKINPSLSDQGLDKEKLQDKAKFLQIGCQEMGPKEVRGYIQRSNDGCSGSKEGEAQMRGECSGCIEGKAPLMCVQEGDTHISSSLAAVHKSEAALRRGGGQGFAQCVPPVWAGLWPYFYNMYLMEGMAPLAFPHVRPLLTPQGWALPYMPPSATNVAHTSSISPHTTKTPTTFMLENFDSATPNSNIACTPTRASTVPATFLGKRSAQHASFDEDHQGFCTNSKSPKE